MQTKLITELLQERIEELQAREAEHIRDIIRLTEKVRELTVELKRNKLPDGGKGK